MNIAFLYNVRHRYPDPKKPKTLREADFDDPETTELQIKYLKKLGYKIFPIEANEEAYFKLYRLKHKIDLVFNVSEGLHGNDREAQIPAMLEMLQIPYTGSGHIASALGMNKILSKEAVAKAGIKIPVGLEIQKGADSQQSARQAFNKISPPWVVKPVDRGSSVGLYLAKNIDELAEAIEKSFEFSDKVLVEEYIKGREATCGLVEGLRGQELYPLFPIEIIRPGGALIWNYNDKYSGETNEICPGNFSEEQKKEIQEMSLAVHRALGLRHYSRTDFIISPRGIYFLETYTLPGLTDESLLPKALLSAGVRYPEFLDHLITLALKTR